MCGEKCRKKFFIRCRKGSPPRVRGEGAALTDEDILERITPACAGRSGSSVGSGVAVGDHPRVCGEKQGYGSGSGSSSGSPPRVRGEGFHPSAQHRGGGITPACAGRRTTFLLYHRRCEDHPRVCGEKGRTDKKSGQKIGSPPRVRGEVRAKSNRGRAGGITPACAGRRLKRSPI